jgi:hypothetical protein
MLLQAQLDIKIFKARNLEIGVVQKMVVTNIFNTSLTNFIFTLQVMSHDDLELELVPTVVSAPTFYCLVYLNLIPFYL